MPASSISARRPAGSSSRPAPHTLYIRTDLGVFVTVDGGGSWMRENTGFANVVTEHLQILGGRLFAFTHGRSAWSVALAE